MGSNIPIGLAFLAGLASFLSPCVFSLVPVYIGYLGGRAAGGENSSGKRLMTFKHGLAFVLGFSFVFISMGAVASSLGALLYDWRHWIARTGGIMVIVFGMHMTGLLRIPLLEYDLRIHNTPDPKWGYLSSFLMGIFFSAGWSPCIGPVLGAILTLAMSGTSVQMGMTLLFFYSLGLAVPFLVAALGIGWLSGILGRYGRALHLVEIGMGVVLVAAGLMLLLDLFEWLSSHAQFYWIDFGI